jgi:hypothetical protein
MRYALFALLALAGLAAFAPAVVGKPGLVSTMGDGTPIPPSR